MSNIAAGMERKKKQAVFAFIFIAALLLQILMPLQVQAYAPDEELLTQGIYMVNLDTNTVVYEKSPNEKMYPASLTKIMTAIIAIENCDLQEEATAPSYIYDEFVGINVSHANIQAGETLTIENLLYAMLMQSANEAAKIIADHVGGGSIDTFVEMMNNKAKELGANNTHFVNPHGLFDEQQYTTPYDMYLITKYAMGLDGFMDYVTTLTKEIGPTNLKDSLVVSNRISMMQSSSPYYYEPLRGIKTGTLVESGRCFISTATLDGYTYLLVMMGSPYVDENGDELATNYAFTEAKTLYEWAFSSFRVKTLVQLNQSYTEVPVNLGKDKDLVQAVAAEDFSYLLMDEIEVSSIVTTPQVMESIDAPVREGDQLGTLQIMLAGEQIGTVPLVAGDSVELDPLQANLAKVKEFFSSFIVKFVFLTILIFLILYITVMVIRNYNKKRYSRTRSRSRGRTRSRSRRRR